MYLSSFLMNRFFILIFCLCFVLFSCKGNQGNEGVDNAETSSQEIAEKEISNIDYIEFLLDPKTEEFAEQWIEYNQLSEVIENIKIGDFSFFYDNRESINVTLTEFKSSIPEPLNTSSITARMTAFETKLLKFESLCNLASKQKEELLSAIKEVLVAFSNLNLQMNKKVEFDAQNIQRP